jgi:hypothetical protein
MSGAAARAFCDSVQLPTQKGRGLAGSRLKLAGSVKVIMRDTYDSTRSRLCGGVLVGTGLLLWMPACNALLNIEQATLACDPGGCDAGTGALPRLDPVVADAASVPSTEGQLGTSTPVPGGASAEPAPTNASGAAPLPREVAGGAPSGGEPNGGELLPGSGGAAATTPVGAASSGPALDAAGLALPLPDDLIGAPVQGEIGFSDEAVWEVDGVFQPTFEIHTPTASYWIVKPLGTMVSMEDGTNVPAQWISFSSGFRPLRGVPSFAEAPVGPIVTVRDDASQTPTHLRLTSESQDGTWQWVWDFYVTHVTFTINRAPATFGFAYQGVPGGSLGTEDQLVQSDGTLQGARNSFNADLGGPVEWAYLADTTLRRSLVLLQHTDDTLPERYQVRDNDTALWRFGDGQITTRPIRFSMSLIDSSEHAAVAARVAFISAAIR